MEQPSPEEQPLTRYQINKIKYSEIIKRANKKYREKNREKYRMYANKYYNEKCKGNPEYLERQRKAALERYYRRKEQQQNEST